MPCNVLLRFHFFSVMIFVTISSGVFAAEYRVAQEVVVEKVPSWFPVGFCLLTHGKQQYVAYYDEQHQMTVASRTLGEKTWKYAKLDSKVGWDSHNYITMAIDEKGALHLSGNMHVSPLVYFRSDASGGIESLRRMPMTGEEGDRVTYPRFMKDADGNLLFFYRSGSSGNGSRFFNRYDVNTETWGPLLKTPLFNGEGKRNAYPMGPEKGPDGYFHVVWVWRDTYKCETNNHLSYAKSKDMVHWESASGTPVSLPMKIEQEELWVDPIPSGGGIINGCAKLAFDSQKRPIISYHKADKQGYMQIYLARFENGEWKRHPITEWDKKITFEGGGTMPFIGIHVSGLTRFDPNTFFINYRHRDYGSGRIVIDQDSLKPVSRKVTVPSALPRSLAKKEISFEGIRVRRAWDIGSSNEPGVKYLLQWEALPPNRDRARKPPLPPASTLRVIKLVKEQ